MPSADATPENARRPTLRDVAQRAGVSHMTVSRVINGDKAVSETTRRQVEQAVHDLRFVPNPAARALSGGEQLEVALLHRFPNPGSLGDFLVQLVQDCARTHSSLFVREITSSSEYRAVAAELKKRRTRAVILVAPLADESQLTDALRANGIAIVAIGTTRQDDVLACVGIDDREAARAMTQHLLDLGHRRIAFIKGNPDHASTQARLSGYLQALDDARIPVDEQLIADGLYTYQSGLNAADRLLRLPNLPSAIFASNDDMAAGVVSVAHQRGIVVPVDLSICGFDDAPIATTIWPELTTVRRPTREITRAALSILQRPRSPDRGWSDEHTVITLDHAIIRRGSCAPPRSEVQTD